MPTNAVYYITDIAIPNTWATVETDYNDKLYIAYAINQASGGLGTFNFSKIQLLRNNYTTESLAFHILFQLNSIIAQKFTSEADTVNNRIIIGTTDPNFLFHILTDNELKIRNFIHQ